MDTDTDVDRMDIAHMGDASPEPAASVEIVRDGRGRIADAESARALSRERWDRYREAIERGASTGAGVQSAEAAVERIMEVTAARAVNAGDPKQLDAAREVMNRLVGTGGGSDESGDVTFTARVPASAVAGLAEALARARTIRQEQV